MLPPAAGIGLRHAHFRELQTRRPALAFLEVHSENYFGDGGRDLDVLTRLRRDYAVSLHGVGMSIASAGGIADAHLAKLKRLVERIEPAAISEHLCWSGFGGQHWNDLLPLPHTRAALDLVAANVTRVQDTLQRALLVENISSYVEFVASEMSELEFIAQLARRTGCRVLLDINNVHVNAVNHGFDAARALESMPADLVDEVHLAGHFRGADCLIDHHGDRVAPEVWALYESFIRRAGPKPTLIEWDTDLPALDILLDEARLADQILEREATHA